MSDPSNVLPAVSCRSLDEPDSPASVGWTHPSRVTLADARRPLQLDNGATLSHVDVEFETYGELNPRRSNAIMVMHALSGDAHVAGWDATWGDHHRPWREKAPGWWDNFVGPGKPLDTDRYFVICANVLGSCYGTTGPASINPATGRPYRLTFPAVSVGDWVRLHVRLLDYLDIPQLLAVVGGSLGGQQALEFSLAFPDRLRGALVLAASPHLSTQGLAFNAVARHAILSDPDWCDGAYDPERQPERGLAIARMIGHITYLSEMSMNAKFGRRLQRSDAPGNGVAGLNTDQAGYFEVESYLHYQGGKFVERFDAASYLYILHAMDHYDASHWGDGNLLQAAQRVQCHSLVVSFSSDWLYTPAECRCWANALSRIGRPVTYVDIDSSYGHDAFLLEADRLGQLVDSYLRELEHA